MSDGTLRYSVITPVRNEEANLPRLAACLQAQTVRPTEWVILDTGSHDQTPEVAARIGFRGAQTTVLSLAHSQLDGESVVVRAFRIGVEALHDPVDVVVKRPSGRLELGKDRVVPFRLLVASSPPDESHVRQTSLRPAPRGRRML